jgi:CubicO group peptidase (beta-lactamase class C family)
VSLAPATPRGLAPGGAARIEARFQEHLDRGWHPAAQLAVVRDGRLLVELAGGDVEPGVRLHADDLMLLFSSGKPLIAVAVLMLIERGRLGLDDRIADYWPEFAQGGKGAATVRHALTHRAGCPQLPPDFDLNRVDDWDYAVERTASVPAAWAPGTDVGYHTLTFGWILGELVRRIDGRMPRDFIRDEIVAPLGLEGRLSLGVEGRARDRRVRVVAMSERTRHDPAGVERSTSRVAQAYNSDVVARAQIPAANCYGTARALATFYAALLADRGEGAGRLLEAHTVREATRSHAETVRDRSQDVPKRYGLGCYVSGYPGDPFDYHEGADAFGHSGQQSSVGYADAARGLAVAYVTNGLHEPAVVHRRVEEMARAIREACA